MQKRGVIVDVDDFLPVRSTYPEHPLSKEIAKVSTMGGLQAMRRDSNRKKIDLENQINEEKRMQCTSSEKPYVLSEFNIQKPRFTSIK
jgi:hypothetical protein